MRPPPSLPSPPEADDADPRTESPSSWPYASLLLVGTFGARSPAERRLAVWSALALTACVAALFALAAGVESALARYLLALVLPGSVATIGRAQALYLRSLDDLSRRIQLEAAAFAYGAALFLGFAWVGWLAAHGIGDVATAGPGLLMSLVLAEPLRGIALVRVARKYE